MHTNILDRQRPQTCDSALFHGILVCWTGTPRASQQEKWLTRSEGTCTVQMVPESVIDQVASWTKLVTIALRVAQTCVHQLSPSQQGNSYMGQSQARASQKYKNCKELTSKIIDRLPSDPAGAFFSPSLHIWIFPKRQVQDAGPNESVGSNNLETCAVQHRQGITDPPGCAWDTMSTANSVVGGGL